MFTDSVELTVSSGKGGQGCVAFRREKFVLNGGPNGGDGGKGGKVFFLVDNNTDTLSALRGKKVIKAEETSFSSTLERGLFHFEKYMETHTGYTVPGKEAFKLYDTYGLPVDILEDVARYEGLKLDIEG